VLFLVHIYTDDGSYEARGQASFGNIVLHTCLQYTRTERAGTLLRVQIELTLSAKVQAEEVGYGKVSGLLVS